MQCFIMKGSKICFRSLRKVMLRTCIGADGGGPGAEYPNFAENKVRVAHNGHNGDLAGHHVRDINSHHHLHGGGGGGGGWSVGEAVTSSELGEVLSELSDPVIISVLRCSVSSCPRRFLVCQGTGRESIPHPGETLGFLRHKILWYK